MEDRNSVEYLERIKNVVMEHLREIGGPPGIQMTGEWVATYDEVFWVALTEVAEDTPRLPHDEEDLNEKEDLDNPDERRPRKYGEFISTMIASLPSLYDC